MSAEPHTLPSGPPSRSDAVTGPTPVAGPDEAYLVVLKGGPIWRLDDHLAHHAAALSARFAGEIWAFGPLPRRTRIGRFEIRTVLADRTTRNGYARFARAVLGDLRARRRSLPPRTVLVAYDPLKSGLIGLAASRLLRVPLVVELNGDFASAALRAGGAEWKRAATVRAARFVLDRASAVRTLFDGQAERLGVRPDVPRILGFDSIDAGRFAPGATEPIVLSVGYPAHVKGMDVLVEAFLKVAPRFPDWRLVLIGHELDRHLPAASGHPQVEILPGMPNVEVAAWMGRAGVYALASRTEAMGRVLLEAAAAGKPRVGTAVGGVPRLIADGVDGLLVPSESPAALADALARLLGDPALRHRLGVAARERVRREFSAAAYVDRTAEVVRAALARHAGPR